MGSGKRPRCEKKPSAFGSPLLAEKNLRETPDALVRGPELRFSQRGMCRKQGG
jgi:hypothetical protein